MPRINCYEIIHCDRVVATMLGPSAPAAFKDFHEAHIWDADDYKKYQDETGWHFICGNEQYSVRKI